MQRRIFSLAVAAAMAASGLLLTPTTASATPFRSTINTSSLTAVQDAYLDTYVPALSTGFNWTGSVSGCKPGTISASGMDAALTEANFIRAMAGLPTLPQDATESAKTQQAALMMQAQDQSVSGGSVTGAGLSHDRSTSWACGTTAGASTGPGGEAIAVGWGSSYTESAKVMAEWMQDQGTTNIAELGHRFIILDHRATSFGFGATTNYAALHTSVDFTASDSKSFGWPSAGYFPYELLTSSATYWSYNPASGSAASASVKMTVSKDGGSAKDVSLSDAHGVWNAAANGQSTAVAWKPSVSAPAKGTVDVYTVTISGQSSYQVKVFNANDKISTSSTRPSATSTSTPATSPSTSTTPTGSSPTSTADTASTPPTSASPTSLDSGPDTRPGATTGGNARLANGADSYLLKFTVPAGPASTPASSKTTAGPTANPFTVQAPPAVKVHVVDNKNGTYSVKLTTTTPGNYTVTAKAGSQIIGRPVSVNFIGTTIDQTNEADTTGTTPANTTVSSSGTWRTATGRGFLPGEQVRAAICSDGQYLGVYTADGNGQVTARFGVSQLATGTHTLEFVGEKSGVTAVDFPVQNDAAAGPQEVPSGGNVASSSPLPWIIGGVLIAAALVFGIIFAARRRHNDDGDTTDTPDTPDDGGQATSTPKDSPADGTVS